VKRREEACACALERRGGVIVCGWRWWWGVLGVGFFFGGGKGDGKGGRGVGKGYSIGTSPISFSGGVKIYPNFCRLFVLDGGGFLQRDICRGGRGVVGCFESMVEGLDEIKYGGFLELRAGRGLKLHQGTELRKTLDASFGRIA